VKPAVEGIQTSFDSFALPYIEQYSNLDAVFRILSCNDRSSWVHSPIHGARCQRALAAAVILKKYDSLEKLIQHSEAFLKSQGDFGLRAFQQFSKKVQSLQKS
jgi:hypothetical protein